MSELEEIPNSKRSNGAFIVIILLLCIGLGFMAYLWSSKNKQLDECSLENQSLISDMDGMNEMLSGYVDNMSSDLRTDFKNMLETYDALIKKDASKSVELNEQKAKILQLQEDLQKNKNLSAHQLMLARKEIETMKQIMRGYIVQIDSLNTLNLQLTNDLDSTNSRLATTTQERDQAQNDLNAVNEQLDAASKLSAYAFSSGALKAKLGGEMGETTRARNAAQLKSSFTIGSNAVAQTGSMPVYMQITGPDGKVLQKRSSNTLKTISGSTVAYTDKKEINYTRQSIDVIIYYDLNGASMSKGNYKVRIYCRGHLIGSDSFTLK